MSKEIRWQGSFANKSGKYTVNIYGEAGVDAKTITLGDNPLTTEEDAQDDLRIQTGTLEVYDPDGTLMDEMMPADNLDHPVTVTDKDGVVVWQGFLSCEAYSQEYNGRPKVITFNLLSVLAALEYVEPQVPAESVMSVAGVVNMYTALLPVLTTTKQYRRIGQGALYIDVGATTYLQTASMVEREEKRLDTGVIQVSYRCKPFSKVIGEVCRLLSIEAREKGQTLYFRAPFEITEQMQMSDFVFNGVGHTKTYIAPAKRVKVKANLTESDTGISIPDMPTVPDLVTIDETGLVQDRSTRFFEQQKADTYDNIILNQGTATAYNGITMTDEPVALSTKMGFNANSDARARFTNKSGQAYVGAEFVKGWHEDENINERVDNHGIYAMFFTDSGLPDELPTTTPGIIRMKSVKRAMIRGGQLVVKLNMSVSGFEHEGSTTLYKKKGNWPSVFYLYYSLKVGGKYYRGGNDAGWSDTYYGPQSAMVTSSNCEITINVPASGLDGEVEFCIYPVIRTNGWKTDDADGKRSMPAEIFFTDISAEHSNSAWSLFTESENEYTDTTTAASGDEVDISIDYATDRGNVPCDNTIVNASGTCIAQIDSVRPETLLLTRMKNYYSAARQKLEIEAEPIANACTKKVVSGAKTYRIAAERIDWRLNKATYTLLETLE